MNPMPVLIMGRLRNDEEDLRMAVAKKQRIMVQFLLENGKNKMVHMIFRNKNFTEEDVIELLEIYFGREVDSSIQSKNVEEVLSMAVAKKMKRVVEFLLEKFKYTIDKTDKYGNSIAHLLVDNEKEQFFQFLTPFIDEIVQNENKSAGFVEWLMDKGLDFDCQNHEGKTALHLAVEYNLQHVSRVLLKYTQNIHHYLDQHNRSLLHLFLEKSAQHRDKYRGIADEAMRYYSYTSRYSAKCVKLLLDKGVSPLAYDCWDRTPLYMAIKEEEDTSIAEMMIDRLLETKNVETTMFIELLKSCAWWGEFRIEYFLNILLELVTRGVDVDVKDRNGTTPVYWAFRGQNRGAVTFLSDHHADFGVVTEIGENLLHALAKRIDRSTVPNESTQQVLFEVLLKKGCTDVNAKTRPGDETPLHLASESGYLAVVRKLIKHGATVNCKNTSGETPLHLAVHSHSEELAEFLLLSGADVNSRDECGRRPLYHASTSPEKPSMVAVLLRWGAYVNVKIVGESPFSRAVRHHCLHNAREMLAYGADINDNCVLSLLPSLNNRSYTDFQILLMRHWIKLNTAELPASKKYADYVKFEDQQQFYDECSEEVEKLKKIFIDNRTSIYAFLHMDITRRCVLINNKNLPNLIYSPKFRRQFPNYTVVILACYRGTVLWKSLLEPAARAWFELTGIRLPIECLRFIFAYLRNADLLSMIDYEGKA